MSSCAEGIRDQKVLPVRTSDTDMPVVLFSNRPPPPLPNESGSLRMRSRRLNSQTESTGGRNPRAILLNDSMKNVASDSFRFRRSSRL